MIYSVLSLSDFKVFINIYIYWCRKKKGYGSSPRKQLVTSDPSETGSDLWPQRRAAAVLYNCMRTTMWIGRQDRRSPVAGSTVNHDRPLYVSKTYLRKGTEMETHGWQKVSRLALLGETKNPQASSLVYVVENTVINNCTKQLRKLSFYSGGITDFQCSFTHTHSQDWRLDQV